MSTQAEVDAARKVLEEKWDAQGDCGSCTWHACLYEHDVDDVMIAHALEYEDGLLRLNCVNKTADEPESHRGIKINIKPGVQNG